MTQLDKLVELNGGWNKMNWISVKDRLPEEDERVLCCGKGSDVVLCEFHDGTFYLEDLFEIVEETHVTHWMPLPEPPEVE